MDQLYDAVEMCFDIQSTSDECEFLNTFIFCVMSDNEETEMDLMESKDKLFYKEVLCNDSKLRCNFEKVHQCSKNAGVNWKVAEELDWFLFYVFNRRFGWPDLEEENGQLKVVIPDSQVRYRKSGKTEELKHKSQLVDMLDTILLWLSRQSISAMSVLMYSSAVRLASKSPVTRLHLAIRGFDWLKDNLVKDINEKLWHSLQELLILGITDFWSRIRDSAILRLGPIIERLKLSQILSLFDELIRLCDSNVNEWKIIDGAISGICAILKRFEKVGYKSEIIQNQIYPDNICPRFHYQIKVGEIELDQMPPNIISRLQFLVFKLIYHPQQTIRDNSIKAFVLCLDRYYENDVHTAFQNVCQKLPKRVNGSLLTETVITKVPQNRLQSYSDPYGAQSLICLCHHLFKRLHDKINYLENWHHYHCYFDQYLFHPASSVRLVTSNLYTYAVSQAISYPCLVKNIIHNLIFKWSPDQSVLLQTVNDLMKINDVTGRKRMSISNIECEKDESTIWEWREGRLLVFELLAKLIIKNHLWYTFGTTEVDSVYSSDNTNSKLNGSGTIYPSSDRSCMNLYDSNNGIPEDSYQENIEEDLLSMSLDGRRLTLANLPGWSSNFKTFSEACIPTITECDEDLKRRKSYDTVLRKVDKGNLTNKIPSFKNLITSRLNVGTSTKNLHYIVHSSFLVHIKDLENAEMETPHSKNDTINHSEPKLPTFRSLLSQMLHTSAESLIDSQWELRRMAKQALPPLGEVLRWFDPELMVNIINTHLKFNPTLMTAVSLQLLYDSLLHTCRLKLLNMNPPSSWQPNVATRIVDSIISSVEFNLPQWMKSCQHYLDRSTVLDCITPYTINIVITSISNYFNVVPVCALSKSLVEVFVRLDKCIKGYESCFVTIYYFEIYPNPTNILASDYAALDYAVQLINFVKDDLLGWWQKLSLPANIQDYYDQHKEAIFCCSKLMSIFASWLLPISEMRGDNVRYLKDIHKLVGVLLKLLIEVMKIDIITKSMFAVEFIQLTDVLSSYLQNKNVKLDMWWMRQLLDITFAWLNEFNITDLDTVYRTDKSKNKPLFLTMVQALLQRLHYTSNHRRATVCSVRTNHETNYNVKAKRHSSIDENCGPAESSNSSNFIHTENKTNIELFSSQATSENVEYVSDESLNDSERDRKSGFYRESHVLSSHSMTSHSHPLPLASDLLGPKHFTLTVGKSNSSLIFEESDFRKQEMIRSSSSVNSDSVDEQIASDWDSTSESNDEGTVGLVSPRKNEKSTIETTVILDLIGKIIRYNSMFYDQCKPFLSEIDFTILNGLKL